MKLIELNDTSKLARYDYNVTNLNETVVAIFAEGELLVELNDEWQVRFVAGLRNFWYCLKILLFPRYNCSYTTILTAKKSSLRR